MKTAEIRRINVKRCIQYLHKHIDEIPLKERDGYRYAMEKLEDLKQRIKLDDVEGRW